MSAVVHDDRGQNLCFVTFAAATPALQGCLKLNSLLAPGPNDCQAACKAGTKRIKLSLGLFMCTCLPDVCPVCGSSQIRTVLTSRGF